MKSITVLSLLAILVLMIACQQTARYPMTPVPTPVSTPTPTANQSYKERSTATIKKSQDGDAGKATFTQTDQGVQITVTLKGIPPGPHAIHLHETGRCDGPDFQSAGPHVNPAGKKHDLRNSEGPHAGDLPAINVNADGRVTMEGIAHTNLNVLLDRDGSVIVVRESPDDDVSDPSGNSGARIACGIIN